MECKNEHFRHILLFYFRKGKKAAEAHKEICEVYGVDCITDRTCQNWFKKFRSGDFSLKDDQRSGRPTEVDDDQIKAIIEEDRHITVREIAERLNVSHTTIENHLKCLGLAKKLDIWVPHILKEIHLTQRIKLVNRKGIVFHHDNARPHTSLVTRGKLLELGWEVMSHPPYSPDMAPSDYHLFRSLQNSLKGKTFTNDDDLKSHLVQFFADKDQKFYERGIMKLQERWQKVIEQNGKYMID
ncbi:Histone-lysine N-methyltransferase SETMAR [Dufourea novaeangliae]|uniref:Histone-lysine N-methyltransferase SETMAR n=1 Tax=Dufourea novaeangliae TaxID=178035 RepID=A0A154P9E7_DUFNO|nr:Histone-lysine N-methyltransferase SETMAR [Dufourea novaeangliae]